MSENKVIWHPIEEGYPLEVNESMYYLVTFESGNIDMTVYSGDLYELDKYDFSDFKNLPKEERKGFVWYDSQFGCYTRDDVIAWAYLPEPYKDAQISRGD